MGARLPNGHDLNVVTLREHLETMIHAEQRAHDNKHELEQRALEAARTSIDLRLEKLNELRSEVLQDRTEYVRSDVFRAQLNTINADVTVLKEFRSKVAGAGVVLALVAGIAGAAIVKALGG